MADNQFRGCKLALLLQEQVSQQQVLVLLRDDKPDIEFPNMWDLPGGGREGIETPEECVLRELREEFGLRFDRERLLYKRQYHNGQAGDIAYFFVANITPAEIAQICFGEEGQCWKMMPLDEYLSNPQVIPRHQKRMRDFLDAKVL